MWVFIALVSSSILGIYDIFKKISLKENLVISVLIIGSICGALLFVPLILLSRYYPGFEQFTLFYIPVQSWRAHMFFFSKSMLVGSSWILAYFAIKHLPITIVSTIRSSGPMWTLLGAIVIFGERLNFFQWVGIIVAVFFFYLFGTLGKKEGIQFKKNKWVLFSVAATLIGSVSSLYDKFLVHEFDKLAMQAWFSIYMPIYLLPFLLAEKRFLSIKKTKFTWRWTIPLIGISLVLADFAYFWALSQNGAMISIVSALRRTSVVFTFLMAGMFLKEKNIKIKFLVVMGILFSVALIIYGTNK
jgi:bacterial/archaeal transporter family protein